MIRLRESIKQKEEFLKSPLPLVHLPINNSHHQHQQHHQQAFFPHTSSPILTKNVGTTNNINDQQTIRTIVKQTIGNAPLSAPLLSLQLPALSTTTVHGLTTTTTNSSSITTKDLLPAVTCDIQNFNGSIMNRNKGSTTNANAATAVGTNLYNDVCKTTTTTTTTNIITTTTTTTSAATTTMQQQFPLHMSRNHHQRNMITNEMNSNSGGSNSCKYVKDMDYLETLQETGGVTNKVFERKLVSHMAKGFDPFKPLSINTNAHENTNIQTPTTTTAIAATATSATTATITAITTTATMESNVNNKKPPVPVLYESLQHHPLHQLQLQQLQQQQHQPHKLLHHCNVVDGQTGSRMEIHKASLATTIDHTSKYTSKVEDKTKLIDITETVNDLSTTKVKADSSNSSSNSIVGSSTGVVLRRLKPMLSFDETKPMRRISYLRATKNENDFQADSLHTLITESTTDIATATFNNIGVIGGGGGSGVNKKETCINNDDIAGDANNDPTYDVVHVENFDAVIGKDNSNVTNQAAGNSTENTNASNNSKITEASTNENRRTSISNDLRNSLHIDNVGGATCSQRKLDTKDIANDIEAFETEMEIKSSCIYGKRISEYRSWRQVKIDVKGDILKIYPSRNTKSDNNVIELDIRNFKIIDESVDKKKYIFRMQSKPIAHLATLGNEMFLDVDASDKLTSSGSSSSTSTHHNEHTNHQQQQQQQQQYTDILFKTKSVNEMRRIFGLLQWKNSLIYDDCDLQGKQLAVPQKVAATSYMPTGTYCDDNVQHQHQSHPQHLQPDYSPISRNEIEASDSISPVMKTRKSASHKNIPDKDYGSPKTKNWKDLLFRRGGGSSSSSSSSNHTADISPSNSTIAHRTTGSIGVPLKLCPMSKNNEYVPLIVEVCTNIVETKGLNVVGIYRIPGNKAAISELSEQVNRLDFAWERCYTDVRWEDVNVVSSLLKLFIRSLPDALLPSACYNNFIEADKKSGLLRLKDLQHLLNSSLQPYSYETMKHLIRHLSRVSKNCEINLMEPKNLAIIFGPSIIRTPNDTLEIAVKDMKHQCRIVELLVTQYDYFFENGITPDVNEVCGNQTNDMNSSTVSAAEHSQDLQTNMLLHNVSKIERLTERDNSATSKSRFIQQLRRRTHSKRSGASSDTYSGESVLHMPITMATMTTASCDNLTQRQRRRAVPTIHDFGLTLRVHFQSLDYTKGGAQLIGGTNTAASSSSSSSTTQAHTASSSMHPSGTSTTLIKKKERGFLGHTSRTHHRKASLDEKDSGSGSGSGFSIGKEQQRSSVDISILLTDDDESGNSRFSDTGSMSLTTITDTLDTKLRNLRSGSESNDENVSPEFLKNRRHTLGQPLHIHSENIPYADESPERHFHNTSCPLDMHTTIAATASSSSSSSSSQQAQQQSATNPLMLSRSVCLHTTIDGKKDDLKDERSTLRTNLGAYKSINKLQHSATAPIHAGSGLTSPPITPTASTAVLTVKTTTAIPLANVTNNQTNNVAGINSNTNSTNSNAQTANSGRNTYTSKNLRFSSLVYEQGCSEEDSEGSTTSDPKESLIITSPQFFLERYNKKRRDHRLYRSASFNCRNYSTRHNNSGLSINNGTAAALTKDEKTDMNLTKKRQIQNKQNRSIKRRHTVGGPHDYAATTQTIGANNTSAINTHAHHYKGNGTSTTSVLRRIAIPNPAANGNLNNSNIASNTNANVSSNNNNNSGNNSNNTNKNTSNNTNASSSNSSSSNSSNSSSSSSSNNSGAVNAASQEIRDGSNGNSNGAGNAAATTATTVAVTGGTGEHVLEVGIRIKNINRGGRY